MTTRHFPNLLHRTGYSAHNQMKQPSLYNRRRNSSRGLIYHRNLILQRTYHYHDLYRQDFPTIMSTQRTVAILELHERNGLTQTNCLLRPGGRTYASTSSTYAFGNKCIDVYQGTVVLAKSGIRRLNVVLTKAQIPSISSDPETNDTSLRVGYRTCT